MLNPQVQSIKTICKVSFFAACIALSSLIIVPLGPVPLTFQDFSVCLTGLLLGPKKGVYAVLLYISAGALGFPIFSGGRAGIGHLFGPTGGYLLGFISFCFFSGVGAKLAYYLAAHSKELNAKFGIFSNIESQQFNVKLIQIFVLAVCCFIGLASLYFLGISWLSYKVAITLDTAFTIGAAPFIALGIPKVALAICAFFFLKKYLPLSSSYSQ